LRQGRLDQLPIEALPRWAKVSSANGSTGTDGRSTG
jgi:hypothetical protein